MLVRKRPLRIALLCSAIAVLALESLRLPAILPIYDFVEYWSASRLFLSGGNPYSPDAMLVIERTMGWQESRALMMLNPPWTLPLIAWIGLLPFRIAQLLWFMLSIALLFGSVDYLWRYYGGDHRHRWVALATAGSFVPTMICLKLSQITCFMLAGVVAFLYSVRSRRPFLAGASLLLLGLKPHLLFVVFIAVVFWIISERRWAVAAGAAFAYAVATAAALLGNHSTLAYLSVAGPQAAVWVSSIGGLLRLAFGAQHLWLQFVPSVFGAAWAVWWWKRERQDWDWAEQMPFLVLVSLCTTTYGWYYDHVLVLTALIPAAVVVSRDVRRSVGVLSAFAGANILLYTLNLMGFKEPWFFWAAFVWLAVYIATIRHVQPIAAPIGASAAQSH